MALLGHTIVELGWTRLQALWPQTGHSRLQLRQALPQRPDPIALELATALYSGQQSLTADRFADLSWLPHFANSGRQLLLCHALRLLEGWNSQKFNKRSHEVETELVLRLVRSAGAFASALHPEMTAPICHALQGRIEALSGLRSQNPHDQLTKAMTLIEASRVIEGGTGLAKDAARILDQALPALVAADGGPAHHSLEDYVTWISFLLQSDDVTMQPQSRHALDRARPFLSMLMEQNRHYCFKPTLQAYPEIADTPPMQHAPVSGVARLSAGKTVVISMPHRLSRTSALHVSTRRDVLLCASQFIHHESDDCGQRSLMTNSSEQGHLLQQATASVDRTVFLSPSGEDLRVEDVLSADGLTRWMKLRINPEAKISAARNGTTATIALDGRNLWQLSLRGAKILPTNDASLLLIETTTQRNRINWALKRIRSHARRASNAAMAELPFGLEIGTSTN